MQTFVSVDVIEWYSFRRNNEIVTFYRGFRNRQFPFSYRLLYFLYQFQKITFLTVFLLSCKKKITVILPEEQLNVNIQNWTALDTAIVFVSFTVFLNPDLSAAVPLLKIYCTASQL